MGRQDDKPIVMTEYGADTQPGLHSDGISRVDGNKKGVLTHNRRPKASAHELRRRRRGMAGDG